MDKKTTHNNLAEKLIESESRFRVQYQNNPIPTFTWRYIGDTFILEDYNVAASALTKGDIVKYLNKTAWEMYQNRPDILLSIIRSALLSFSSVLRSRGRRARDASDSVPSILFSLAGSRCSRIGSDRG